MNIEDIGKKYANDYVLPNLDKLSHVYVRYAIEQAYIEGASLAIQFAEWINEHYHVRGGGIWTCEETDCNYTTSELFTLFLNREQ